MMVKIVGSHEDIPSLMLVAKGFSCFREEMMKAKVFRELTQRPNLKEGETYTEFAKRMHESVIAHIQKLDNKNDEMASGPCQGKTPLSLAAEFDLEQLALSFLNDPQVDINTCNSFGGKRPPVQTAALFGSTKVLKILLERLITPEKTMESVICELKCPNNENLLLLTVWSGSSHTVGFLLTNGANRIINNGCGFNHNPLQEACRLGFVSIVKILLEYGAIDNIDMNSASPWSP